MTLARRPSAVPLRAWMISLAAMSVPALGTVFLPRWTDGLGALIWLTWLVPALLLAYYRGLKGVALALAGGTAVLSLTQLLVFLLGTASPDWALSLGVVVLYLGISIAIAIFAEMLHRERQAAEEMALLDRLTGLPNRRHAELTLESEFAAAIRGRPLAVVVFDLDHFKWVNDRYGHDAGDEALRMFARILAKNTRRMNLSARFGGEEFISVLADCDAEAAVQFANRVREGIKARKFPWGRVTVTAGAAAYHHGMGSHEVLVAHADRALYAAKEAGRDRVCLAQELPPGSRMGKRVAVRSPRRPRGSERIMVVDDDAAVLRLVARVLRQAGYRTEESNRPEEVLRHYQDGKDDIDLLITDVMMPEMNGLTLVDRISSVAPEIRVVYMSGYIHGHPSGSDLPGSVVGFLQKPVRIEELLGAAREVLDRQP